MTVFIYQEFVDKLATRFRDIRLGLQDDGCADLGSLVSVKHREHVAGMVERARGYAKVLTGGEIPSEGVLCPRRLMRTPSSMLPQQRDRQG